MSAPEGFIIPTIGQNTANVGVMKAVSGSVGTQAVRFYIHQQYDAQMSKLADREVYVPVEMCGFKNDRYTETAIRVQDLTPIQRLQTQELYERFKSQTESGETPIEAWDQLVDSEKVQMLMAGIKTVEQLARFEEHDFYRLGVGGKELAARAKRHLAGKEHKKIQASSEEMLLVIEENKRLREEFERRDAEYLGLQERLAAIESGSTGGSKKPKGIKVQIGERA